MYKFSLLCILCALALVAACGGGTPTAKKSSNPSASVTPAVVPSEPSAVAPITPTATATVAPVPAAQPTSPAANATLAPQLQLTAESKDTIIVLSWTGGDDAGGYFVYRDGNADPLTDKPLTTTTYQDIGLTNGRSYTYTVAVVSADGTIGARSAPVTAVPKSQ